MKLSKLGLALSLAVSFGMSNAMAIQSRIIRSALPPNNLHLMDNPTHVENIDERTFNAIIDAAQAYFTPIVAKHNAKLTFVRRWNDGTVNAYAQQIGSTWQVTMFGGLARRPEITPDGFALVVCHELGHHLAGYAFIGEDWASTEGNSDYFATQSCAHALWAKPSMANHLAGRTVARRAAIACDTAWKDQADRDRCYRSANAGLSLATLLAVLGNEKTPSFDTPDMSQVTRTNTAHPQAQCRLDTYFQGALCTKPFDLSIIPGRNFSGGQDTAGAEMESAKYTCMTSQGFTMGARPRCWFKPYVDKTFHIEESTNDTVLSAN